MPRRPGSFPFEADTELHRRNAIEVVTNILRSSRGFVSPKKTAISKNLFISLILPEYVVFSEIDNPPHLDDSLIGREDPKSY
jgi:hypothetical protein